MTLLFISPRLLLGCLSSFLIDGSIEGFPSNGLGAPLTSHLGTYFCGMLKSPMSRVTFHSLGEESAQSAVRSGKRRCESSERLSSEGGRRLSETEDLMWGIKLASKALECDGKSSK